MATQIPKVADVPLARPGFDALGLAMPVIVQVNPQGNWETQKPDCLDEERLKAIVQYLSKSNTITAAQNYCCQCARDNKNTGLQSDYVPVIMLPLYSADDCPFDIKCEIEKMKSSEGKATSKAKKTEDANDTSDKASKPKKRPFVMQRLTDFDLLSQW